MNTEAIIKQLKAIKGVTHIKYRKATAYTRERITFRLTKPLENQYDDSAKNSQFGIFGEVSEQGVFYRAGDEGDGRYKTAIDLKLLDRAREGLEGVNEHFPFKKAAK